MEDQLSRPDLAFIQIPVHFDEDALSLTIGDCIIDTKATPCTTSSIAGTRIYKNGTYARLHVDRKDKGFVLVLHYRNDRLGSVVVCPRPQVESELAAHRVLRALREVGESLVLPSWLRATWAIDYHDGQPLLTFELR